MFRFALVFFYAFCCSLPSFLQGQAPKEKCVLVVGGAGFIGSHVNKMLNQAGYQTLVLDNLSRGNREAVQYGTFIEGDLADVKLLDQVFTDYAIDAVMHFAALTEVGESVQNPLKYYINNVVNTLNLLEAMLRHQVNVFIFSSSAAIFGNPQDAYVTEEHPCNPINPYGQTKLMVEHILHDLSKASTLRFCCLRYFNAAGGDSEGQLKNYKAKESNFIPIVLRSLLKPDGSVTIFGTDYPTRDGTGVRDYIHVEDLGSAHILAMEKLFAGAPSNCYNLGNGQGFSVREVIAAAEEVTGKQVNVIEGARRAGDPPFLVANSKKAYAELNWKPRYTSLHDMIKHAWQALQ
ncbi:MAG: UDP-glucose 4-epimerase GalE [Parachlamydia sp.]|nr:MAG: UDP-glucose 4-epimerase GalE [Parachlamydia sp.]